MQATSHRSILLDTSAYPKLREEFRIFRTENRARFPAHYMQLGILATAVAAGYMERSAISHLVPFMMREMSFGYTQMGYVLSAFGIGYVFGLPFSGAVISWAGHRKTLCFTSALWSLAAVGFAVSTTLAGLVSARFLLGLAEAPLFPLFVSWIGARSTPSMVSFEVGAVEAASYVGMALAGPIAVFLATQLGWRWAYFAVGSIGLVVTLLSSYLENVEAKAATAPTIDPAPTGLERNYKFLAALVLWGTGFAAYNLCKSFYSTWMPTLLIRGSGWNSTEVARLTLVQSTIAPFFSILSGLASTMLIRRGHSLTWSRLLPMLIGFSVGATLLLPSLFPKALTGLLLTSSFVGLISTSALIWCTPNDLSFSPRRIAYLAGYLNAFANLGSIVSPLAIGALLAHGEGTIVYALMGGTSLLAAAAFIVGYLVLGRKIRSVRAAPFPDSSSKTTDSLSLRGRSY